MYSTWTPELINTRLSSLPEQQRNLIDFYLQRLTQHPDKPVSTIAIHQFGYEDRQEYEDALVDALRAARRCFAEVGIHHVYDLDFPEQGKSSEGAIAQKGNAAYSTPRKPKPEATRQARVHMSAAQKKRWDAARRASEK